jgi:hypothetical protein
MSAELCRLKLVLRWLLRWVSKNCNLRLATRDLHFRVLMDRRITTCKMKTTDHSWQKKLKITRERVLLPVTIVFGICDIGAK